jgi:predicted acylesterase/phospholipase RssA
MPRSLRLLLLLLLSVPARVQAQSCGPAPTALVLSGGGAKGLAHIGVLRVLDSLGIHPDLVIGTSMGAMVGALYASGYSAAEVDSIARAMPLDRAFGRYDPSAPQPFGALHPLVVWERNAHHYTLQTATIRESEVNSMINRSLLRGNLAARGDFDRLPVPFRAVATNLQTRDPVVLASGDLAHAVRASLSVPLLFRPVRQGDALLIDGGLSANVPVPEARALGPHRLIISDVTGAESDSTSLASPEGVLARLVDFLFLQASPTTDSSDVWIRPDVKRFKPLEISPQIIDSLTRLGAMAARAADLEDFCAAPAPATPVLPDTILEIHWSGGTPGDYRAVGRALDLEQGSPVDTAAISRGLDALGGGEWYRAVWLNPAGTGSRVSLAPVVVPEPNRLAAASVAYSSDLGGRIWIGAMDRALGGSSVQGSAAIIAGQLRQELTLDFRLPKQRPGRPVPLVGLDLAHENVRYYLIDSTLPSPAQFSQPVNEATLDVGLSKSLGSEWTATLLAIGTTWAERGQGTTWTGGVAATLGDGAPDGEPGLNAQLAVTGAYTRVGIDGGVMVSVKRLRAALTARYGWGSDLPLQLTFPLGGTDAFPGLHYAEYRGDREAMAKLSLTYPIIRPVSVLLEAATGQVTSGGEAMPGGSWWVGGRAGLEATTPLGIVRADYGFTRDNNSLVTVRIGRWF